MTDILQFLGSTPGAILLVAIGLTLLVVWAAGQNSFGWTDFS